VFLDETGVYMGMSGFAVNAFENASRQSSEVEIKFTRTLPPSALRSDTILHARLSSVIMPRVLLANLTEPQISAVPQCGNDVVKHFEMSIQEPPMGAQRAT
jgi:hypothetical protein